ncbi:N-acetylneuraminate synthase [Alteromonas sp. a30]|uniref:N-acetylneuraminate synthase n=1 Tax=Alteromonas sp. a30 TaxID=2730917 RepID=UPI0022823A24|nr:N-acetylneuraminate synthase [Alteromonas sp. a30]MCY7294359.1 N-acetylneuraminate synthase [Alteromonas sp. a30]
MSTFIIAEAGVNHNGELDKALQLVDVAVEAGADAVKFQTFKSENLVTESASKAEYQKKLTDSEESQIDMLRKLELPHEHHFKIKDYCESKGIEFMSTAFDLESLDFLLTQMDLKRLKLPSGEITNLPLVFEHAKSGLDVIVSTGMATLSEIEQALKVISGGFLARENIDVNHQWDLAYTNPQAQTLLKEKVSILQCVTEYPAPADSLNLKAIQSIRETFGLNVGYSDHSLGIWAPISAVTLGATIVEKHFTLDKTLPGPDHQASLEPYELKAMVDAIRNVEVALGDGIKRPVAAELKNREPARKSLVITAPLKQGEEITAAHLSVKRPEKGMSPSRYWDLIGKTANKDYQVGDFLED